MRSVVIPVGRLAAGALGLLLALTPLVATAQAGMDPAVRATAEMAVVAVGRVVRPATVAAGAPLVANLPNLLPTPTPPPAPTLAPAAPSFDVTAATAYESAGVTVAVPAGWDVESDDVTGLLFDIAVPDTDIFFEVHDGGSEAPGLAALVMFRSMGEALTEFLAQETTLDLADIVTTDQGLPLTRLQYHGSDAGDPIGGAFYIIAAGQQLYLVMATAPVDLWPEFSEVVDWMARGLVVDEELVDLAAAEGEDYYFVDDDGQVEVWVPDGWRVAGTQRAGLPAVVADADYRFALMLTGQAQLEPSDDLLRLITMFTAGISQDVVDGLAHIVMDAVLNDYQEVQLDVDTLVTHQRDGGVTVGVAGDLIVEESATVPMTLYLDLGDGRLAAAVAVGDMNALLAEEETVLRVVQSLAPLE